jgi:hypothetical protein
LKEKDGLCREIAQRSDADDRQCDQAGIQNTAILRHDERAAIGRVFGIVSRICAGLKADQLSGLRAFRDNWDWCLPGPAAGEEQRDK